MYIPVFERLKNRQAVEGNNRLQRVHELGVSEVFTIFRLYLRFAFPGWNCKGPFCLPSVFIYTHSFGTSTVKCYANEFQAPFSKLLPPTPVLGLACEVLGLHAILSPFRTAFQVPASSKETLL